MGTERECLFRLEGQAKVIVYERKGVTGKITYRSRKITLLFLKLSKPSMAARSLSSFTSKPLASPKPSHSSGSASRSASFRFTQKKLGVVAAAGSSMETNNMPMTRVVFQPFMEVKKADLAIPITSHISLARQRFVDPCEAVVNELINVEYNVSYVYHSMYAYFDRDNVALKGLARFFKEASVEEKEHAEKVMEYQNKKGGRVKLHPIVPAVSEFEHAEK